VSKARQQDISPVLLHPCRSIQKALGVCEKTVYWWAKRYGLPLFHLPDGQIATTVGMIEQWAQERRHDELTRFPSQSESTLQRHGQAKFKRRSGVAPRMQKVN
jgi:hypothetical protein